MSSSPREASLDGLRGAAAVAVVYMHYLLSTGIAVRPGGGNVGVLVFFVLSGYLITQGLWRAGDRRPLSYESFVRRRCVRLLPALFGAVLIASPVMAVVGPEPPVDVLKGALIALMQLTAFYDAAGLAPAAGWLPTWSLTVEWVFYLTWPLAIVVFRRRGIGANRARTLTLISAGCLYLAAMPLSPRAFYTLPLANVAVMLVGASLALAHSHERPGRGRDPMIANLGGLLFVLMVILPSSMTGLYVYRFTFFPIAVVAAYAIMDQRPGTVSLARRVLESRPLTTLGRCSYSLYLWHLPLLWIVWWLLPGMAPIGRLAIALAILGPVVYTSYRFLERPWLKPQARVAVTVAAESQQRRGERGH